MSTASMQYIVMMPATGKAAELPESLVPAAARAAYHDTLKP